MDNSGSIATSALCPSDHVKQEAPVVKQDASTAAAVDTGAGMTPVETPKVSMMAKVGTNFVIPKNKALVPVTRTTTKWEPLDPKKEELKPLSRKTKWGLDLTEDPVVKRGRALALQTRAEQLAAQLESNNLEIDNNEATRSPSPPPLYDAMGHRMNTREGRKRDQLDVERREAIGECMKLNPFYKPPSGFRPVPKEAKLFIPVKEHPGYNFIGLILGPRGNTQKRLEADTGCKITIRGKGSIKDGKTLPYRHGKDNDGASEDLHVHIAADTCEKVDAAVAIIEPLLIPVDEDRNIYKMKQLRELAEMNGTVRDFIRICTLCGEEGHREWQCPKDKLQTFQAKVICRLCGDGSHPTMDCPLKHSGQGKAIDKEYLSFLEELGAGLGGIDPPAKSNLDQVHTPSADASQPMLLTASGAHPMPSTWMGLESDKASDVGGFPRFPFPFPFPPPGPQGMNAMNFLPRFFRPAFLGLFRGPPFPPATLQMMAFMVSAFRGRFPFPPFGLRPNMMRPPMPPSSAPEGPTNPTSGQSHTSADSVADGAALNNFEPAQNYSEFLPPSIGTFDSDEKQHSSGGVPAISSVEAASFSSSSLPPFLAATSSLLSKSPPFETATTFPSAGNFVSTFSSVSTTNVLLPEVPSSGHTVPPVTSPQSAVPSFRPVPSVRPVIPPVVQSPSFSHLGGLAPPVRPPSWVGTSNISSLSSLDNLSKPSQTWTSSVTWSPSQFSMEASSTSQLNKPASEYVSPQFFPKPSTFTPVPPRIDTPYSFNSGESPTLFSTAAGSGPSTFSTLHPRSVSSQFGYLTPRSISNITPAMPPSITPSFSNTAQDQLGAAIYNQPKDLSLSYSDSRLGPPSAMGSHFRAGDLVTATPPVDYHPFSSLREHSTFSQQGLPVYPPAAPPSSRLQIANDYQHGSPFSASDVSYARRQESSHSVSHLHLESRIGDVYNAGHIENHELRGTTTTPPSEALGGSYRYEPSIPMHLLQQRRASMYEPWNANLPSISRPGVQQGWGQRESGGQGSQIPRTLQEGDPEYDKLMSSVGVL